MTEPIKALGVVAVVFVAFANIGLNILIKRAAWAGESYLRSLGSTPFLLGLVVGSLSILGLLFVYRLNIDLAQGILLMGAVSIVGGSILGIIIFKSKLHPIEIALLIVITALFVFRWILVRAAS